MFGDANLVSYLDSNSEVNVRSVILAEWNMNNLSNIDKIGNYRYRPFDQASPYFSLLNTYDEYDDGNFYTDATDADVLVDGGYEVDGTPAIFRSVKNQEKMLYSLEQCFYRFRPRSGINKLRYFNASYLHHSNPDQSLRPRYYAADKEDTFKYWSSFRTEDGIVRGMSTSAIPSGGYRIDDTAPFVVYKDSVPANSIVVKMQTHVGSVNLGPFSSGSGTYSDPFYGYSNSKTPAKWKIQYLSENSWVDAISFEAGQTRPDGTPIIDSDGYVEIRYGLIIPASYRSNFFHVSEIIDAEMLPENPVAGSAYLVKGSGTDIGTYHYYDGATYRSFVPQYGWFLKTDEDYLDGVSYLTEPVAVKKYNSKLTGRIENREFQYIDGLRIVVDSMNTPASPFELIEISPRLVVDMSDRTTGMTLTKSASDLGTTGMPVGQLLASTGSISLFDFDNAFNPMNADSVIAPYVSQYIQFRIYDLFLGVNNSNYVLPIKTLYSDGFPKHNFENREVSLDLRDAFFRFEALAAPELMIQNASLSYAVSTILDAIGFSNYVFKRVGEEDPVIPYFFVAPDTSIADVLQSIAVSTQSAMYFDEENNFVVMTKEFLLPEQGQRDIQYTLTGKNINGKVSNIEAIQSQENHVYNGGTINYSVKYIQKTYGTVAESSLFDRDKTWIYKPALLWEVSSGENTKSVNNEVSNQSSYSLTAMPLNYDLSDSIPTVVDGSVINNTVNFGESVYWMSRYAGYFYANGEIIRYDAVEYNVSGIGDVWVTSTNSYQGYFAKLPFGGKIYPTGRVRIFTEPYYDVVDGVTVLREGAVAKHGRGQFGTAITKHYAGLPASWSDTAGTNTRGAYLQMSDLLQDIGYINPSISISGANSPATLAKKSTRNSIIKNFISRSELNETSVNSLYSTETGTVQASALVFNGPTFANDDLDPANLVSYTYKALGSKFRHFGTRMRVVGRIENSLTRFQTPVGSTTYARLAGTQPDQDVTVGGSSGGLAIMVNPDNNQGYYLELSALTVDNLSDYDNADKIHNVIFYKATANGSGDIVPVKLWGAQARIIVDSGQFVGQSRYMGEENPTVYDVAVEYEDIDDIRRFYIYLNNKVVGIVDDSSPLTVYNNMALFVRGTSRCMFENVYAIDANYAKDSSQKAIAPVNSVFSQERIDANSSFRKYAMSGAVQSTYLSGINTSSEPGFNMYFEEFGTIMREAAYFDIKYDKAYPALYAKLSPTFNSVKGYVVSGFMANAYGAEFLVFNATDSVLSLDESSGNYLRIQGVTFTQSSDETLTVDDYFNVRSDFSNPIINSNNTVESPIRSRQQYFDIKNSRSLYGLKEFTLDAKYIQSRDAANELMSWVIAKTMRPRKSVGLTVFGGSFLQIGDLVNLDVLDESNNEIISNNPFVVYSIEYSNTGQGPETNIYLSEVI